MVTLLTTSCTATELSVHSVLAILVGHLSMPNDLNLSIYRCQPASGNLQAIFRLQ